MKFTDFNVINPFVSPLNLAGGVFLCSLLITIFMINLNIRDLPGQRSSHSQSTPKSGGVAIVVSFYAGLYLVGISPGWGWGLVGGVVMALLGLIDDIKPLPALQRLGIQLGTVVFIIAQSHLVPGLGGLPWGISLALASIWCVGYTNAFNFMDGLNGIAGGVAIVSTLVCVLYSYLWIPDSSFILMGIVLTSAVLGFWILNIYWGKIFLGDVGSQFLGYMLSLLPLFLIQKGASLWIIPLLYGHYIWDVGFTLIRKLQQGIPLMVAHKLHFYQLLQQSGWSHTQVAILQMGMVILQGLGILILPLLTPWQQVFLLLPYIMLQVLYSNWVLQRHRKVVS